MNTLRHIIRTIKKGVRYTISTKQYYGAIELCSPYCYFLPKIIMERMHYAPSPREIACFTSYFHPVALYLNKASFKFFYNIENTHVVNSGWQVWENCYLWKCAPTLSLGFDYTEHPKHLRFPYWLEAIFGVMATRESITELVRAHNYSDSTNRGKECAFICKKDYFGDRAIMADMVAQIMPISYPSDFRHNDDEMRGKYGDDKIAYLRQFKFNLCPENSNNRGYVTEKIFEAIKAGCVPIYWGNEGYPEPDILNPKAIVYLDRDNPEEGLSLLRKLYESSEEYAKFAAQPRFLPGAESVIYAYYERLENKLREILA